jgi:DNA-directed RNA polymerase subunit RPC12/RpoP
MSDKMAEPTFQITYICNNCNHSFKERYEKGVEVKQEGHDRAIVEKSGHGAEVECPNCGSKRIIISGRQIVR